MIVKGFKTLQQLEERLSAIPQKKRKVIILVGRHPNEGTIAIANRHHLDWEKHGAVTVQLPREWTSHYFWHNAMRRRLSAQQILLEHLDHTLKNDHAIVNFLSGRGFRVPFVNFHGTGSGRIRDVEGRKLREVQYYVRRGNRLFHHYLFRPLKRNLSGAEVVVEFYYNGKRKHSPPPAYRYAIKTLGDVRDLESLQYLLDESMPSNALKRFSSGHARRFEEALAHLARTGLKKR